MNTSLQGIGSDGLKSLAEEERPKEKFICIWGGAEKKGERGKRTTDTYAIWVECCELGEVTLLSDLTHFQEILQNHKRLEVIGFLLKTNKVPRFCITVFVVNKIETVRSGAGA